MGLLRLNHTDAIRMGDGQRIMDINMYLYLLYKQNNCPKYAYGILETLVQANVLLSERLAYRLIWNRTVNHQGKADTNHPKIGIWNIRTNYLRIKFIVTGVYLPRKALHELVAVLSQQTRS